MSQLSSSSRLVRSALKRPSNWQNPAAYRNDASVHSLVRHSIHDAISTRSMSNIPTNTPTNNRLRNVMVHNHLTARSGANLQYDILSYDRRQHIIMNWTIQNHLMSTTTGLDSDDPSSKLDTDDTENSSSGDSNESQEVEESTLEKEPSNVDAGEAIPFQRSKRSTSRKSDTTSGFDDRAQAKLTALTTAKIDTNNAKFTYENADADFNNVPELHEKWNQAEQNLALAYSQAIKYTSRITKNQEATRTAEKLLDEWMGRFLESYGSSLPVKSKSAFSDPKDNMNLNRKRMVKAMHKIIPMLTKADGGLTEDGTTSTSSLPKIRIPPPTSKDYNNILRAYTLSKARRKGQQCESLMTNMMKLAKTVAFHYNDDHKNKVGETAIQDAGMELVESREEVGETAVQDVGMELVESRDGCKTRKWKSWVTESIPNSKVFAMAIKCHAGSTREY